jgi:hypothetical protein
VSNERQAAAFSGNALGWELQHASARRVPAPRPQIKEHVMAIARTRREHMLPGTRSPRALASTIWPRRKK